MFIYIYIIYMLYIFSKKVGQALSLTNMRCIYDTRYCLAEKILIGAIGTVLFKCVQLCRRHKMAELASAKWKSIDVLFFQWKGVRAEVLNTTFNNISVITWLQVLLVEETGVLTNFISHNVVSSTFHLSRHFFNKRTMNIFQSVQANNWMLCSLYVFFFVFIL